VFSMGSDLSLYNESVFVGGLYQTGDRIGELGRVLEVQHSKVIEEEMTRRLQSDLK
jgi:hypothetical protein